jgi:hypothetical protein
MLYLTNQWPRKGVILPFEVWARNDKMTIIKLFFIFATNSKIDFISYELIVNLGVLFSLDQYWEAQVPQGDKKRSKIVWNIHACFPLGRICMPKMHWLSPREFLGIWAGSVSHEELS